MGTVNREDRFVLMLSSGAYPRYRDDIIRVMALPHGGRLQFRYGEKHVLSEVFRKLSDNDFSGCEALVAYLDISRQGIPPEIVPCRFCRILDSEAEGEFFVIRFEVGGFAAVKEGVDIRTKVAELLSPSELLPDWEDATPKGHFLLALKSRPTGCQSNPDRRAWQAVVANLGGREHFRDSPFFYNLRSVVEEGPETEVRLREGKYVLKPDKIYRAEVVHYTHPATAGQRGGPWGRLDVEPKGNGVQPMTTQHLSVDSPYDIKRVYFRTTGEVSKQSALLSFGRRVTRTDSDPGLEHHDFEVRLEVKGELRRAILVAVFIALSLAVPRWLEIFQLGPWGTAIAYLMGALVTGVLVVFGLRRVP